MKRSSVWQPTQLSSMPFCWSVPGTLCIHSPFDICAARSSVLRSDQVVRGGLRARPRPILRIVEVVADRPDAERILAGRELAGGEAVAALRVAHDRDGDGALLGAHQHAFHRAFLGGGDLAGQGDGAAGRWRCRRETARPRRTAKQHAVRLRCAWTFLPPVDPRRHRRRVLFVDGKPRPATDALQGQQRPCANFERARQRLMIQSANRLTETGMASAARLSAQRWCWRSPRSASGCRRQRPQRAVLQGQDHRADHRLQRLGRL